MKAIFLDIDGVLCLDGRNLAPECLKRLKAIVDATGAVLVLSSDWRFDELDIKKVNDALIGAGFDNNLFDITPFSPSAAVVRPERKLGHGRMLEKTLPRWGEIKDWLDLWHKRVDRYAIIDDHDFAMIPGEPESFFLTDMSSGLRESQVEKIISHLNG